MRLDYKSRLLSLTRSNVLQAAQRYFDLEDQKKAVAVISSEVQLEAANDKLKSNPMMLKRI
jgi:hypothetical protein